MNTFSSHIDQRPSRPLGFQRGQGVVADQGAPAQSFSWELGTSEEQAVDSLEPLGRLGP